MTARRVFPVGLPTLATALMGALLVSGCAFFSDAPKPAPLESLQPKASARLLWSASDSRVEFPMRPVVASELLATASGDGTVTVRPLTSATPRWTARAGSALSAGVGFDGQRVAVVTQSNELVVLANGREVWRKRLASGVSTPPLVAGERVFVLGLDRAVDAFDALDGRYLWRLQRSTDPLSLQQPAVLMPFGDALLVGQGARLVTVDALRGTVRSELALATPRGSNEVERLVDLVGPAFRSGNTVCARAFQSAVGCADLGRGALLWTRNTGGTTPVAMAGETLIGADASDRLTGWKSSTGELAWSHERLLNRRLGGVTAWGTWAVAGDLDGQVHVLEASTGQTVMRLPTDGSSVLGAPVVAGRVLVAVTRRGGVYAWQAP